MRTIFRICAQLMPSLVGSTWSGWWKVRAHYHTRHLKNMCSTNAIPHMGVTCSGWKVQYTHTTMRAIFRIRAQLMPSIAWESHGLGGGKYTHTIMRAIFRIRIQLMPSFVGVTCSGKESTVHANHHARHL
jgi:hypothetical protein